MDASAAIGVAQRKGLGKLRHLNTQALWIQDAVREQTVKLLKVPGSQNPADLMTRHLDAKSLAKMVTKMGLKEVAGRSLIAPKLAGNNVDEQETLEDNRTVAALDGHAHIVYVDAVDVVDRIVM